MGLSTGGRNCSTRRLLYMQLLYMVCIIMLCCLNVRNAIFASTDMVWRDMEQRILSIEIRAVSKAVDRYLGESMPLSAKETTGGNAHIIMFLARNRDREIYQHTIEQKFCITRSTASRVLALMEKKGLIARESVAHDARCKRIVLTDKADAIVAHLTANGERVERLLVDGFTQAEQDALHDYVERMRANIERAQQEFDHQTSSQTPSMAAPEYSEAEVINTKEENK